MSQFNVRESINIPYFDHDDSSLKILSKILVQGEIYHH